MLVGSQGHALSVLDAIEKAGRYCVVGLLDRFREKGTIAWGYEILGAEEDLAAVASVRNVTGAVVAVGNNLARASVVRRLLEQKPELQFPVVVHPSATLGAGVSIDSGTVVMAGTVINARCRIGKFCIVNTQASIGHECVLDDYSSVAPGVVLGGRVSVGEYTAVCLGARVVHKIRIGPHTVIGAGATVLCDLPDHVVAYGTPARVVRSREESEPYL